METTSPLELNDLFIDTLNKGSKKTLAQSDEMIECDLFEDFDIGVTSFLHKDSLDRLLENNYIDDHIYNLCIEIRKKAKFLLENKRDLFQVKNDPDWNALFELSDQVLKLISNLNRN